MRRCVQVALFAVLLLTGRAAFASTITVGDTVQVLNDGGAIYGGIFQVHRIGSLDPIDLLTFCVQLKQDIDTVNLFRVGGINTFADDDNGNDPLDDRSAWIYAQFRAGSLSGYTENEIQSAIWILENEWDFAGENLHFPSMEPDLQNNTTALLASAQFAVDNGYVNTNVRVLNLFFLGGDRNGEVAQDMLVISSNGRTTEDAPVPEPATLLLVGVGAAALIGRRLSGRSSSI